MQDIMDRFPVAKIIDEEQYYAFTLIEEEDGKTIIEGPTRWHGFDPDDTRIELRIVREVYPRKMAEFWQGCDESFHVINTDQEFVEWFLDGGHAVVTFAQTQKHLPWEL